MAFQNTNMVCCKEFLTQLLALSSWYPSSVTSHHFFVIYIGYQSTRPPTPPWCVPCLPEKLLSFKESGSYNLRSNTSYETKVSPPPPPQKKWRQGLHSYWPPFSYQEYPECPGFRSGSKDRFISFGICPVNQFVYSGCGVLIFSKCTFCYLLVFASFYYRLRICI